MFLFASLSKSTFFTRAALVSFVQHSCSSCLTCITLVSLVQHSCCTCVALGSLVSHSCRNCVISVTLVLHQHHSCHTRVARVCHSCCKLDQIKLNRDTFFTLKSFRKKFQSTTDSVNARKLLRLSTHHCKLFLV